MEKMPNKQQFPRTRANREIMETVMKTITVVLATTSASPPRLVLCLFHGILVIDSRLRGRIENVCYSDLSQ